MINQNALNLLTETSTRPQNLHLNKAFTVEINIVILLGSKKPTAKIINVDR